MATTDTAEPSPTLYYVAHHHQMSGGELPILSLDNREIDSLNVNFSICDIPMGKTFPAHHDMESADG